MKKRLSILLLIFATLGFLRTAPVALALELDWSGQFRSEYNLIHNYELDTSSGAANFDAARFNGDGYYIPGGGGKDANFTTLFLKLRPKLVVNDNIYIKSEWWVGDPIYGMFGNSAPYTVDQRAYYSTQSRGSPITAQRFWAEFLSDFGTIQIGRAPLNWGLGVVWSSGDNLWDRYESTGDVIRLVSKFGAFSFTPAFIYYSGGNTYGGACTALAAGGSPYGCAGGAGSGSIADYSIMFKYENPDEDFEGGVNFIRRLGAAGQDPNSGYTGPQQPTGGSASSPGAAAGFSYNNWDIYGKKRFGKITLGGEVPIVSGTVGGANYSSYALAGEANWKINDTWELNSKLGHASGQPGTGAVVDNYKGFYFNPNYRLGLIMFNYQFANFAGPTTLNSTTTNAGNLRSPWDNPITDANYLALNGVLNADKWKFHLAWIYARANEAAQQGQYFFNTWKRRVSNSPAIRDQEKSLGWELDWGTSFQWDEYFLFKWDFGVYFPGKFYTFSNTAQDNPTSPVFASQLGVGVTF